MNKAELLLRILAIIVNAGVAVVCLKWVFKVFAFKTYEELEANFYASWNNYSEKLKKCNLLEKCKSGQLISLEEIHAKDMMTLICVIKEEYPKVKILWLARKKDSLNFKVIPENKVAELEETGNYFIMPVLTSNPL